jgi:hypothetical protein
MTDRADAEDIHDKDPRRRKNGQFRTGVSGNRRGRPRKARSTRAIFQEMLRSKVPMMVDGKLQRLSVVEAMAARVKREALAGPLRGLEKGLLVAEKYSFDDPPPGDEQADLSMLSDDELEIYGRLASKLLGVPWEDDAASDALKMLRESAREPQNREEPDE